MEGLSDYQLFFKLNLVHRILIKNVDREMANQVGATSTQIAAIFYLLENDGCQLVDLSRELLQNKSAITTLVERMIKNGLLSKKPCTRDGRAYRLYLTAKGKTTGEAALPHVADYNRQLAEGFSPDELETLHSFFDKVMNRFGIPIDNYFKKKL
ncbi:MarR family winged helix-turn-helix transcriptional regulator [Desulfopila sp. IMCC35008]|uniref:MarR family winged helix-turn-helix transcriptional regulator n=1 Tax=Desulfopila sp. IMCC35008 TaxID=2653858 RepID=UPI0013D4090D|nr:MarR family winged helix-turn-helix transcriptional regulator [Desulfopila sp. IMCC35008]